MNKAEVIKVLGSPDSTSAQGTDEYLNYHYRPFMRPWGEDKFVRLRNGVVDAYGKPGDFDSAKDPTINYNVKTHSD